MKRSFDSRGLRTAAAGLSAATLLYGCGGGSSSTSSVTSELDLKRTAASATAQNNPDCNGIRPFYWEIGDQSAALASGSVSGPGGAVVGADDVMPIASASKWLYSTYYAQRRGGALTATDIKFLHFESGYTNLSEPPGCSGANTVGDCLARDNGGGIANGTYDPRTDGYFYYNGGHMQRHAADNGLGALDNAGLASELRSQLGSEVELGYSEPQPAGGAFTSAQQYAKVLRKILDGRLVMHDLLGSSAVCTDPATCPTALSTPLPRREQWHYSIGHWVEDDPSSGDGSFSSPGALGFYPWIDAGKAWYGIVARVDPGGANDSVLCGRSIRKAWLTGTAQ